MKNLVEAEKKYGIVTSDGREIVLTDQPVASARLLNEYPDSLTYHGNGDSYMVEYQCTGVDKSSGEDIMVYWHHQIAREGMAVDGAYSYDTEEADFNWDDDNIHHIDIL